MKILFFNKYLILLLFSMLISCHSETTKSKINLVEKTHKLNLQCPLMMTDNIRLNNVSTNIDNEINYEYTLTEVLKDTFNIIKFEKERKIEMIKVFLSDSVLAEYRKAGIAFTYTYYDKLGFFITKFSILPNEDLKSSLYEILTQKGSYEVILKEISKEMNASCPYPYDTDLVLQNTIVLPNRMFQYNLVFINKVKDSINIPLFDSLVKNRILNNSSFAHYN